MFKDHWFIQIDLILPFYQQAAIPEKLRVSISQRALPAGHLDAKTVVDYLVKKRVPFRTSHDIVGRSVALCITRSCQLTDLILDQLQSISPVFEDDVYHIHTVLVLLIFNLVTSEPLLHNTNLNKPYSYLTGQHCTFSK